RNRTVASQIKKDVIPRRRLRPRCGRDPKETIRPGRHRGNDIRACEIPQSLRGAGSEFGGLKIRFKQSLIRCIHVVLPLWRYLFDQIKAKAALFVGDEFAEVLISPWTLRAVAALEDIFRGDLRIDAEFPPGPVRDRADSCCRRKLPLLLTASKIDRHG